MKTIEEAIAENVAKAPPFTEAQIRVLTGLLSPRDDQAVYVAPKPRPETAEERERRLCRELEGKLSGCAICGITESRHGYAEFYDNISHRHVSYTLAERKTITDKFIEENT